MGKRRIAVSLVASFDSVLARMMYAVCIMQGFVPLGEVVVCVREQVGLEVGVGAEGMGCLPAKCAWWTSSVRLCAHWGKAEHVNYACSSKLVRTQC